MRISHGREPPLMPRGSSAAAAAASSAGRSKYFLTRRHRTPPKRLRRLLPLAAFILPLSRLPPFSAVSAAVCGGAW